MREAQTAKIGSSTHIRSFLYYILGCGGSFWNITDESIKNESGDGHAIVWACVRAGVGSELGVSKKFLSPSGTSWGTQGVGGPKTCSSSSAWSTLGGLFYEIF